MQNSDFQFDENDDTYQWIINNPPRTNLLPTAPDIPKVSKTNLGKSKTKLKKYKRYRPSADEKKCINMLKQKGYKVRRKMRLSSVERENRAERADSARSKYCEDELKNLIDKAADEKYKKEKKIRRQNKVNKQNKQTKHPKQTKKKDAKQNKSKSNKK